MPLPDFLTDGSKTAALTVVLAHGAGAPMDSEFMEVGQWLYNNFDDVSGISFLPYSEHTYQQAPYEEIDKATYNKLVKDIPKVIDWDIVEHEDKTEGAQTLACVGGACEI